MTYYLLKLCLQRKNTMQVKNNVLHRILM